MIGGVPVDIAVDAGTFLRIGAADVELVVFGQRLAGDFFFEQSKSAGPDGILGGLGAADDVRVIKIAAANVEIFLGDPGATAATTDDVGLAITGGEGAIIVTNAGIAASIGATFELRGIDSADFSIAPVTVQLQINNTQKAVNETIAVGAGAVTIAVPKGPYLRVQIGTLASPVSITAYGQVLEGVFAFEQVTNAGADGVLNTTDDKKVIRIQGAAIELFLGDDGGTPGKTAALTADDVGVRISNGTALLLLTPDGFPPARSAPPRASGSARTHSRPSRT